MTKPFPSLLLSLALLCPGTGAQTTEPRADFEDLDISYIYTALLGTGTYTIDGRRISMLKLPVSITQRRAGEEHDLGIRWDVPLVLGYDQVGDTHWVDNVLNDELVTLVALPGVQITIPLNDTWSIKPFGHIGYGHDFISNENILMAMAGVRSLGVFPLANGWDLRWGGSARIASEYQFRSEYDVLVGLFETGLDLRRNTRLRMLESRVNVGMYYVFQWFQPEWDIGDGRFRNSEVNTVNEIGVSAGLAKPRTILGFTFERVRLGYKMGSSFQGWTIGTEFPF